MNLFEQDLRNLRNDFLKLREDMLPALRLAKDAQQPLPNVNNGASYEGSTISPPAPTPPTGGQAMGGLDRKYSTKRIVLGPPKTSSPSYTQTTHNTSIVEHTLNPTDAARRAVQSSSHLAAANGSGANATSPSYPSPNMPSPTSPPTTMSGPTLGSRTYRGEQPTPSSTSRSTFENDQYRDRDRDRDRDREKQPSSAPRGPRTPAPDTPGSNASVEIFKSFRVSMDDPCYKVLPAALKKYQINAPWDQYALYIVYGDQERCLGLDEKPLILFKELDKEGKKPMFMLRKTNNAQVDVSSEAPGSAGLSAAARGAATGYDPPGGII